MEQVMKDSVLCYSAGLAIFNKPSQDIGIMNERCIQYLPVNSYTNQSVIEFCIPGNTAYYTDLKKTKLHLSCKIVKSDGTDFATGTGVGKTNVAPVDNVLSSLFSRVDVLLQDKTLTSSEHTYAYKAYLNNLLFKSPAQKQTDLTTELYYQDPAEHIADFNHLLSSSVPFKDRAKLFDTSSTVDMVGPLHVDICQNLDRYIPSGVDIKVKLYPNPPEFCLLSSDTTQKFKIIISKIFLSFCHYQISPEVTISHNELLKETKAVFPYVRSLTKKYTLPSTIFSYDINDPFNGNIPSEMIIGLVSESAAYGNLKENPYNFEHCNLSYISAQWDSIDMPPGILRPKFEAKYETSNFIDAYNSLRGIDNDSGSIPITRQQFYKGYTLYRFHTGEPENEPGNIPIKRTGMLRISMTFEKKLENAMTLIIYAKFPAAFNIDGSRAVYEV